jgi:malate synthase
MNLSLIKGQQATQDIGKLVGSEIGAININGYAEVNEKMNTAKQFLDNTFPLARGSHKDVSSYEVYYSHLLAFMNDGSQCGLRNPGQFVSVSGQKCEPSAIELGDKKTRVEIEFNRCGGTGSQDKAGIEDIQIEMPARDMPANATRWISLLHSKYPLPE